MYSRAASLLLHFVMDMSELSTWRLNFFQRFASFDL